MNVPIIGCNGPLTSLREDVAAGLKLAIKQLLVMVVGDQLLHAEVVAGGMFHFRAAFLKDLGSAFGNYRAPAGDLADKLYRFFEVTWLQRYPELSPGVFLDRIKINTPPTAQEIEDAWELEIGSSDAAMRQFYEGSARTRKGGDFGGRTNPLKRVH